MRPGAERSEDGRHKSIPASHSGPSAAEPTCRLTDGSFEYRVADLVEPLRDKEEVILLDYTTNGDITDPVSPLSHAALIQLHIEDRWPPGDDTEASGTVSDRKARLIHGAAALLFTSEAFLVMTALRPGRHGQYIERCTPHQVFHRI
ncbi:DUF6939 family protein [Actinomadura graeca]|uniref:DUF6939 family protein n=1 Tax=Actinomadura graeca TaxID=2750812 RepID=UPI003B833BC3